MRRKLVVDSSTLIALERAGLVRFLKKINCELLIPSAVEQELGDAETLKTVKVVALKGRTLNFSRQLEHHGIGKGEAQCCALALRLKNSFIVCDDRRFIRQKFFVSDEHLKNMRVLGFAFFLHLFAKKKLISNIWLHFDEIIKLNNWERSEVFVENYTALKQLGH